MYTLRQYLTTLSDTRGLTRTLGEVELCRDADGRPLYSAGNSAIVFRIRCQTEMCTMRCYLRPMAHLDEIYGERLRPRELFVYTSPDSGEWVDVVVGEWIEGQNLQESIAEAANKGDVPRMATLATAFDRLAATLLADDWAHGDLKPENIIIDDASELHLIDFDAMFLPVFAGELSPELGTAAYQHPARTAVDFDASLDDFPAALISTALHALVLDVSLYDRHGGADGLLFNPRHLHKDRALADTMALFERHGEAIRYRIARMLLCPTLHLSELAQLLRWERAPATQIPELFAENGLWGYRTDCQTFIPPVYDNGFDFSEGLAAVCLGRTWHYIDSAGRTVISCPECEAVKPFRDGRAQVIRNGCREEIAHPEAQV